VTENGITYKANWWTQGNDPAQHNAAFGEPWTAVGGATSHDPTSHDSTAWSEASVYTAGMTAIEDGVIYQAIRGSGQYASREVGAELSYPGKSASPWLSREASGKPVGPP
jgi:chitodextrinase